MGSPHLVVAVKQARFNQRLIQYAERKEGSGVKSTEHLLIPGQRALFWASVQGKAGCPDPACWEVLCLGPLARFSACSIRVGWEQRRGVAKGLGLAGRV